MPINGKGKRVPNEIKQKHAIAALSAGATGKEAAAAAGVRQSTLSRWLRDPEFKAKLAERTEEACAKAATLMTERIERVVHALIEKAEGGDVTACNSILDRIGLVKGARIEHTGSNAAGITINITPEDAERAERLSKKVTG